MNETRIKKIFDILIKDNEFHTSKEIGIDLNLSSRTIRNSIKELNELLINNGAEVLTINKKGSKFIINDKEKFELFIKDKWLNHAFIQNDFNNSDFRIFYILKKLLFASDYIKSEDLIESLVISRSQFNIDIKSIKDILKNYNLKIESKSYSGIRIVGKEIDKRICIVNLFYKNNETSMNEFSLRSDIDVDELKKIEKIVSNIFIKYDYQITQFSFNNLIIHLYISLLRLKENKKIKLDNYNLSKFDDKKEFEISKSILNSLEKEFNVPINNAEASYIYIHLQSKKMEKIINQNDEVLEKVNQLLNNINDYLGINLKEDEELKKSLYLHFGPLISRMKNRLDFKNPLLDDIRKDFLAFECAKIGLRTLEEEYDYKLSDDEIAYVALHLRLSISKLNMINSRKNILIVCATGIGTANLMKFRVLEEFSNFIDNIETCDYLKLKYMDLNKFDLIITSISIEYEIKIPVIRVNIFLDDNDIDEIYSELISSKINFTSLMNENLFITNDLKFDSYIDALKYMIDQQNFIDKEKFYSSILEREKLGSTNLKNGIALAHPIEFLGNKSFIYIMINKKGIPDDNSKVYLILLINIKKEESMVFSEIYNILNKILNENNGIHKIINIENFNEFSKLFVE